MAKSPLSVNKFRYAFFGWWLIWAGLHMILIVSLGFTRGIAGLDSLVSNLQIMGSSWLVINILKYYLPRKQGYWYFLVLCVGLSALITYQTKLILESVYDQETRYLHFLSQSWPVRLGMSFLLMGCMAIISLLWYTTEEEQENRQRKTDTEKLAREAELFKLRQQLQPHFLFNSLNSISALVGSQPEQARKMIQQLSDFLRGTLKKEDQAWVTLAEELQYLELYLDIEKVRFGYRLSTVIETDERCNGMKLPPMLLQPVVENAIKFGLYDTLEPVTIYIRSSVQDGNLQVVVQNPFDPETAYPSTGTGFGLTSLSRRLYLQFARKDLLETRSENNLFSTIVRIPQLS